MRKSLRNFTIQYMTIIILVVIAVWAILFYAYIVEEVYDNIDDGLKNQKIEIIREAYKNESLLTTDTFGINQFTIKRSKLSFKSNEAEKNNFRDELIFMPYDEDIEPYRILNTHFYGKDGWLYDLEIRTSVIEEDELQSDLATALVILYCCIIISIYLVNRIVFLRAFKPFYLILEKLKAYQFAGEKQQTNIQSRVIEFDLLNSEIDKMIARNEKSFKQQKLFIENASHELQTPLAISSNQLELLLEDESLSEAHLTKIHQTKEALQRLIKLNKTLLMLSRIENNQFETSKSITFNAVIQALMEEFEDFIAFKQIQLEYHEHGIFSLNFNEDLAKILVSNLLRNAIHYNLKSLGSIRVDVYDSYFTLANTGKKEALHESHIFERFTKESQSITSNGLGLSLVKSIIETNQMLQIEYQYVEERHVFRVAKNQG